MKLLLALLLTAGLYADVTKCTACHGVNFEKSALGKSAVVRGQSASAIEASLKAYKAGTQNKTGMGALMKGQVSSMSDADIKVLAKEVASK